MVATNQLPRAALLISLETLLLFLLGALDVVWLRGVLPLPHWAVVANGFWLLALAALIVDVSGARWAPAVRLVAVAGAAVLLLGVSTLTLVALRRQAGPATYVHDNAILIEEGIKQLLAGRNFYAADYHGTPLEQWQGGRFFDAASQTWFDNPAQTHYITLPFYTLASAAVAVVSEPIVGFYDQRFTHLVALALLAAAAWTLPTSPRRRLIYLTLMLLNPLAVAAVTMGTSDVFVLAWLVAAFAAAAKGRPALGAAALALAVSSKQTAWLVTPFVVAYWWYSAPTRRARLALWPLPTLALAATLPFALWDFGAFWQDIYRYPAGTLPTSYPIYGLGLSVLLQLVGWPPSPRAYFPFGGLQLLLVGPLLAWLLERQRRDNTLARAAASSAVLLTAFWWLSRFFNENYLWVIATLLATGYVLGGENPKSQGQRSNQIQNPKAKGFGF